MNVRREMNEIYGWFVHLAVLAGGDVLKLEDAAKVNVNVALNILGLKNYLQ